MIDMVDIDEFLLEVMCYVLNVFDIVVQCYIVFVVCKICEVCMMWKEMIDIDIIILEGQVFVLFDYCSLFCIKLVLLNGILLILKIMDWFDVNEVGWELCIDLMIVWYIMQNEFNIIIIFLCQIGMFLVWCIMVLLCCVDQLLVFLLD